MRFFMVLVIWIVFIGGLRLYTWQRDAAIVKTVSTAYTETVLERVYSLEITPTFSIAEDPFALQTDDTSESLLEIRLNGKKINIPDEQMSRGTVLRIEKISGVLAGFNEIYIKASPPLTENMLDHGIRIRLLEEGAVVVDDTVWNTHGSLVSSTISFKMASMEEKNH